MAEGFGSFESVQRPHTKEDAGYKTIFERVQEEAGGEAKPYNWYRNTVRRFALSRIGGDPAKLIRDEIQDRMGNDEEEDANQLRRWAVQGHLFLYEYNPKLKLKLPYYDTFPLVYCVKANAKEFWGANLHYLSPKKRVWVINRLMQGRIDIPRFCFHKYLIEHVDGFLLDLASEEWATAILLPIEQFVKNNNKSKLGQISYKKEMVWEEAKDKFYDKIKSRVVVRNYNTLESKEMVN